MAKQESPKQMRLTDETMEQIRAIAKETGGTHQDVMTLLLQLYQAEQAKEALPDRAKDIEQYKAYMDAATQMYLSVLQDAADIAEVTKTKYSGLIDTLQSQLSELRSKCADAERLAAASKAAEDAAKAKVSDLELRLGELNNSLLDKGRIVASMERQIADMQADVDQAQLYAADKTQMEQKILGLEAQVHQLTLDLDAVKADHAQEMRAADLARQQELINIAAECRLKMDQYQEEHQKQIHQYQEQYQNLLNQFLLLSSTQQLSSQPATSDSDPNSDQLPLDDPG